MEILNPAKNIYHLRYDNQDCLCRAMVRMQEHYENTHFAGKVFTVSEFDEWYRQNGARGRDPGTFSYYTDWNGGNFPGDNLDRFCGGDFNPLSQDEIDIVEFAMTLHDLSRSYFILSHKLRPDAVRHEVAHGLFYINEEYRRESNHLLNWHAVASNRLRKKLMSMGYSAKVIRDEIHAYLVQGWDALVWDCDSASSDFNRLFNKHCPEPPSPVPPIECA